MKLIEYKPEYSYPICMDLSNIPGTENLQRELLESLKKSPVTWIPHSNNEPNFAEFDTRWVHPDYRVPMIDEINPFLPDDFTDLYYLSESPMQHADWIKRKEKNPSLTASDLLWVDNMVDKIFNKHMRIHNMRSETFSKNSFLSPFRLFYGYP